MFESIKIRNFSERERYYKIANEFMKLKTIMQNDPTNVIYYANTVSA